MPPTHSIPEETNLLTILRRTPRPNANFITGFIFGFATATILFSKMHR